MQLNSNFSLRFFLAIITLILSFAIKTAIVDKDFSLDIAFANYVSRLHNYNFTFIMRFVTALGNHEIIVATYILLLLIVLFVIKDKIKAAKIPLIGFSALGLMHLLKHFFGRERPVFTLLEASGYSFPSGHSLNSMVLYGLIIFIINRYFGKFYRRK